MLQVEGTARALLTAERTALNFLGRLSGVATKTARIVRSLPEGHARIIDTRKTTPGLRMLEKQAVVDGGGYNHRIGLFDFILIKENHAAAAGGDRPAVARARASAPGPAAGGRGARPARDRGRARAPRRRACCWTTCRPTQCAPRWPRSTAGRSSR